MIRHGRKRVVIEAVEPEIDGGRFPVKRAVGEDVTVEADVFIDGHDQLAAILQYRREGEPGWIEVPMTLLVNDRWRASFTVTKLGEYRFTVRAWVDRFGSWRRDLAKRIEAGQDVGTDLLIGAEYIERAARRAHDEDRKRLSRWGKRLRSVPGDARGAREALAEELVELMATHADRRQSVAFGREVAVVVDPK